MLVLEERENWSTRRKTSRSKEENQQQTRPTYDAGSGNRTRDTLVGDERSHHCAIPAPHTSPLLFLLYFNFRCYAGFGGVNCSLALCLSVNNCSGHGQCFEADLCNCDVGYTGPDYSNASCESVNYCSGEEDITSWTNTMMRKESSSSNATLSCYSFLNLLNPLFPVYTKKKLWKNLENFWRYWSTG